MYICLTDPCISCVNNVNPKEQKKNIFLGGGARVKLDKLGGGACPKRLKTPALEPSGWKRNFTYKCFMQYLNLPHTLHSQL